MNRILLLFSLFQFAFLNAQDDQLKLKSRLHVSTFVDQKDPTNRAIIERFDEFLMSKDSALYENRTWLESDFEKFRFPFIDLYRVEFNGPNLAYYNFDILQIIDTEFKDDYLVKFAVLGTDSTGRAHLNFVYNVLATAEDDKVTFSRALNHRIKSWEKVERFPITYYISPDKKINEKEVSRQLQDIEMLNAYFETDPIELTYYSCVSPVQVFEVKGYDYSPGMYFAKKGGIVEYGNHVFSGNNSEYYTHEIVHIHVNTLFPGAQTLLNEGIATFFGGSGGNEYKWHKEKLRAHVEANPDFDFSNYTSAFEKIYIDDETPIPYMTGALIYEYVIENFGKQKYFELLSMRKDLWAILEEVGLSEENFNSLLKEELGE